MFKKLIISILCFFISLNAFAQDGKMVDKKRIVFADTAAERVAKKFPDSDVKTILEKVDFYWITYLSDGLKVRAILAEPKGEGRFPAIIYNRGGNRDFGKITEGFALGHLGVLARAGYVVVGSQYRGNDGGEGADEFGGADVNDVLNLIPFLNAHPKVDSSAIGMTGTSRGGMQTCLALKKTDKIKAALINSGAANSFTVLKDRLDFEVSVYRKVIPNYDATKDSALRARSPVFWAEKICKTTPILLLHGTADWRVSTEEALELAQQFYRTKQPFRFVLYEGDVHGLWEHEVEVNDLTIRWFDDYLKKKKPLPNLVLHGK